MNRELFDKGFKLRREMPGAQHVDTAPGKVASCRAAEEVFAEIGV